MSERGHWMASTGALLWCLAIAGCQTASAPVAPVAPVAVVEPVPVRGVGYVVFDAPITTASSALLIKNIEALQGRGAREIDLGLNSPGGMVEAAQTVVALMDRLHAQDGITFKVWNLKLVASAATMIFLDAQDRYTDAGAGFLFHAPFALAAGAFHADTLRAAADKVDRMRLEMRDELVSRTRLTKQQADIYTTRTVLLSADDAVSDGVVDGIGKMTIPQGAHAWLIKSTPKRLPAARPPATTPPATTPPATSPPATSPPAPAAAD